MSKKCCCTPGCDICTQATRDTTYQGTVGGITQTNTPALDPTPPCACSTFNRAIPLTYIGANVALPDFITDAKSPNGRNCLYTGRWDCDSGVNGITLRVIKYLNDTGGTSVYVYLEIDEGSFLVGGNAAVHEGTAVIDADNDRIDCSAIDTTVDLTFSGNIDGSYGGTVWCGGTSLTLRFEAV